MMKKKKDEITEYIAKQCSNRISRFIFEKQEFAKNLDIILNIFRMKPSDLSYYTEIKEKRILRIIKKKVISTHEYLLMRLVFEELKKDLTTILQDEYSACMHSNDDIAWIKDYIEFAKHTLDIKKNIFN